MTKYNVHETYTPDDTHTNRSNRQGSFESNSTDLKELTVQARLALDKPEPIRWIEERVEEYIREMVEESADQLEGQNPDGFDVVLFDNNGEWHLEVTKEYEE